MLEDIEFVCWKNKETGNLEYTGKNKVGQSLLLRASKWNRLNSHLSEYWISFQVMTKRKDGYSYLQQTGRDGLYSLLWAKDCIVDMINTVERPFNICICADNSRRFRVYERGLKGLGFKKVKYNRYMILRLNSDDC